MAKAQDAEISRAAPAGFRRIEGVYTHFNRIELVRDAAGALWADRAWAKDIARHRDYIPGLRFCAPVSRGAPPAGHVKIAEPGELEVLALRPDRGWISVAVNLLPNFVTVWKAARSSDIVHSGGAGWAFPLSFYLVFIRPFARFRWIIVIESMFWRVAPGERASLRRRIGDRVHRFFLTRATRRADIRLFTHAGYRDFFLPQGAPAMINPASWIEETDIVSEAALTARQGARAPGQALRLLFAARLVDEKGLPALEAAADRLAAEGFPVEIGVLGEGPGRPAMEALARRCQGPTTVRLLGTVEYGAPFFARMADYDAVLALSTSNEQPRIIFDAYGQGLPVIASATSGNLSIADEETAFHFPPGDGEALAAAIRRAGLSIPALQAMGRRARARSGANTHTDMHRQRSLYIWDRLAALT